MDHAKFVASWIQSTSSYLKVHLNYTVLNPTTAKLTITICHFTMCLLHVSAFTWPSSGRPQRNIVMADSVKICTCGAQNTFQLKLLKMKYWLITSILQLITFNVKHECQQLPITTRYCITQKVFFTPNLKDNHEEDVQRWKCCFFWKSGQNIQLDYATDHHHTQDNSIPDVPIILTNLANSYFKIGHKLSMIILHIHQAIFNVTSHNYSSL